MPSSAALVILLLRLLPACMRRFTDLFIEDLAVPPIKFIIIQYIRYIGVINKIYKIYTVYERLLYSTVQYCTVL